MHFYWWWWNQIVWIVPSMFCVIYPFIYRQPYDSLVWSDSTHVEPQKKSHGLKRYGVIQTTKWDRVFKVYVFTGIIYYVVDSIYILQTYGLEVNTCLASMFLHHLWTIMASFFIFQLDHYPWFISFSVAFHWFLILFPEITWFNYVYISGFICFAYAYMLHPWNKSRLYLKIYIACWILAIPIALLWWNNWSNSINY